MVRPARAARIPAWTQAKAFDSGGSHDDHDYRVRRIRSKESVMSDEEFFADIPARFLMLETPADRVQLPPPPPAAVSESPAVWHPVDSQEAENRVALGPSEDERSAAALYAVWLGGTLVHMNLMESRPEREEPPAPPRNKRDDDEES